MKQTSLDALNSQLFETIEMLKNNNDPKASENEKIDVETAKTIANIGKTIVDGYKVKAQVLGIINKDKDLMPKELKALAISSGINTEEEQEKSQ